jgi:hypothetical protein
MAFSFARQFVFRVSQSIISNSITLASIYFSSLTSATDNAAVAPPICRLISRTTRSEKLFYPRHTVTSYEAAQEAQIRAVLDASKLCSHVWNQKAAIFRYRLTTWNPHEIMDGLYAGIAMQDGYVRRGPVPSSFLSSLVLLEAAPRCGRCKLPRSTVRSRAICSAGFVSQKVEKYSANLELEIGPRVTAGFRCLR